MFPLIVQMPILIGFYHAIIRTKEIAEIIFYGLILGITGSILYFADYCRYYNIYSAKN